MIQTLDRLALLSSGEVRQKANKLSDLMASFSAIVTLVGQVKAGKTALTNALAGTPGLLPMDVNPWTSRITSSNEPEGWLRFIANFAGISI